MRGELCIGAGAILSLASLLFLIFMHVGQINTSTVPHKISMINVNVSAYGQGIAAVIFPDPVDGLYTNNASAPLSVQAGLRAEYKWGLYGYCAYVNDTAGLCSNSSAANRFRPYDAITSDMAANYTRISNALFNTTTFTDSAYLGEFSNGAYYLLLLGTIFTAAALFCGMTKHTFLFLLSTVFAILGSITLLIGATIWTVIIKKTQSVNTFAVGPTPSTVPLGIDVTIGSALYLAWAAFGCLTASIVPYMISCCTYRG